MLGRSNFASDLDKDVAMVGFGRMGDGRGGSGLGPSTLLSFGGTRCDCRLTCKREARYQSWLIL